MNVHISFIVDGTPTVSHQWPVVPRVGETVRLQVDTTPKFVEVTDVLYWHREDCRVDLTCKEIKDD